MDKERILTKIDELNQYLKELEEVKPSSFKEYQTIETKRSCERILQLSIECIIDICKIIVANFKLGVPSEENDLFKKIFKNEIVDEQMFDLLKEMRGFRNILVHEYAEVDDEIVFKIIKERMKDFENFKTTILKFIRNK